MANVFRKSAAASSMQGWRQTMEDAHTVILQLPCDPKASFFGVYDGHGGIQAARYISNNLHKDLTNRREYSNGDYPEALRRTFLEVDQRMRCNKILPNDIVGSTANIILIKERKLYCANVGDSRSVASICGHATALSYDHKPSNPNELKRIKAAGAYVYDDRINNTLNLSRAFGDFELKNKSKLGAEYQPVSPYPDIAIKEITNDLEFIVIGCDGIWEVKSNQEVVDFVRNQLAQRIEPEIVVENLMMECMAKDYMGNIGLDNMTVILICFLNGLTFARFSRKCSVPRPSSIDAHLTLISLETGPPDISDSKHAPRRQRHWGIGCLQCKHSNDSFDNLPILGPRFICRPVPSGRRATVPNENKNSCSNGQCSNAKKPSIILNGSGHRITDLKRQNALAYYQPTPKSMPIRRNTLPLTQNELHELRNFRKEREGDKSTVRKWFHQRNR